MNNKSVDEVLNGLMRIKRNAIIEVVGSAWKLPVLDSAISLILNQQTEIARLQYELKIEREAQKDGTDKPI